MRAVLLETDAAMPPSVRHCRYEHIKDTLFSRTTATPECTQLLDDPKASAHSPHKFGSLAIALVEKFAKNGQQQVWAATAQQVPAKLHRPFRGTR